MRLATFRSLYNTQLKGTMFVGCPSHRNSAGISVSHMRKQSQNVKAGSGLLCSWRANFNSVEHLLALALPSTPLLLSSTTLLLPEHLVPTPTKLPSAANF